MQNTANEKGRAKIRDAENNTEENQAKYEDTRRGVKHVSRRERKDFLERKLADVERNVIKNFYKQVTEERMEFNVSIVFIEDKDESLVPDIKQKKKRCQKYF